MNPISVESSRLQRFLSEVAVADVELSHVNFADKLSQLIDLSDSISLAASLRALTKLPAPAVAAETSDFKAEFLGVRAEILGFIANSFVAEGDEPAADKRSPFILPRPNRDTLDDPEAGFQPYQRFYHLHQSEMEHRLLALRQRQRQALAAQSQDLARLAALDRSLADTLSDYTARVFAGISRLLARRFFYLSKSYRETLDLAESCEPEEGVASVSESVAKPCGPDQWLQQGGWLDNFIVEMQGLLVAELDLRLMPLLGLMEALELEVVES